LNLAILDPLGTTAFITTYHGYMIYDTLHGQTGQQFGFKCTPQIVEGHLVENDGKTWKLALRDVGDFVYCKRCWHLKRRGARSALTADLARGGCLNVELSSEPGLAKLSVIPGNGRRSSRARQRSPDEHPKGTSVQVTAKQSACAALDRAMLACGMPQR
jgi:hypothetical protein